MGGRERAGRKEGKGRGGGGRGKGESVAPNLRRLATPLPTTQRYLRSFYS